MKSNSPQVFDHIAASNIGSELSGRELSEFVTGIAHSLLSERGYKVLGAMRLVFSETPVIIAQNELFAIPYDSFPNVAEISEKEKSEIVELSKALSKDAYAFPLSIFCLDSEGEKNLKGSGYIVKEGDVERV